MKRQKTGLIKYILIAYFSVTVLYPLLRMLLSINGSDFLKVVRSAQFSSAFGNSLLVTFTATLVSVVLAFVLAYSLSRTNIRGKSIFEVLLALPMLVPSISHSSGLIMLLGTNGTATRLLHLSTSIYGFQGIVTGSVIYSCPFAFLMLRDILKYEDYTPYEAAEVLGIPRGRALRDITLPFLRRPLLSVFFSTFSIIFTDYGIPLTIGGRFVTLPVIMYSEVIGQLNFSRGCALGVFLLLPAIVSFLIDTVIREDRHTSFTHRPFQIRKNTLRDVLAYVVCIACCVFILLIIVSFVVLAFAKQYPINMTASLDNVKKTFETSGGSYLLNTLVIALATAALGTVIAFATAYYTGRTSGKLSRVLHLTSITSLAIPGMVLGLTYVIAFKGGLFYGTLALLIIVNVTHFVASPYLMMYNSFSKMNANLEAVGDTLGVGRLALVRDVFVPMAKDTLMEMFSYMFVNSMITISAVSFLATTRNKPFALLINQFDQLMIVECSAVVSLVLLAINLLIKMSFVMLRKKNACEVANG